MKLIGKLLGIYTSELNLILFQSSIITSLSSKLISSPLKYLILLIIALHKSLSESILFLFIFQFLSFEASIFSIVPYK